MEFTVTVTPKSVFLFILAILAIVFIIYLILLVRKLIGTLSKVDLLLEDSKTVTEVAARRTQMIDGMMDDVGETVGIFVDAVKGNQNIVKAASSVINAAASFVGIVRNKKEDDITED